MSSLSLSFSSMQTDQGDLPSPSPCSPNKILARIFPLSFPSWTRGGRRSLRPSLCQTLSPYSRRHHHPLLTPSECAPFCRPPRMTPRRSDRSRYPSYARGRRHAHRGRPTWARQHRPPPDLSPRRQAPLRAHDQFPRMPPPRTQLAPRTGHDTLTRSGRPERSERAQRSDTHAYTPAPLRTQTCTALHAQADATVT
jgi:hypothetical protein